MNNLQHRLNSFIMKEEFYIASVISNVLFIIGIICSVLYMTYDMTTVDQLMEPSWPLVTIIILAIASYYSYFVNISRTNSVRAKVINTVLSTGGLVLNPFISVFRIRHSRYPDFMNNVDRPFFLRIYIMLLSINWLFYLHVCLCIVLGFNDIEFVDRLLSGFLMAMLLIPTAILYRINYFISQEFDSVNRQLLLLWLMIFYSPLYSFRVLRKKFLSPRGILIKKHKN